jgi:peptide/nickel transport system substrate-binding protein
VNIECINKKGGKKMEKAKYAILFSVLLVLASVTAFGIGSVQAQEEFPREETVAMGGDASYTGLGFNPYGAKMNRFWGLVYMPLFWYSYHTGLLEPWLAESFDWSSDGSKCIVNIQPTACWRDGTPVTAEDVVFSFDTLGTLNPDVVVSVTAADEKTVHFNVASGSEHNVMVPSALPITPIIPKARWEGLLDEYGDTILEFMNEDIDDINGSGPYTPCVIEPTRNVFERIDDWWGNDIFDQPEPKYVMVLTFIGPAAQQSAFDEGTIDWSDGFFADSYTYVMTHADVQCWDKMNPDGHIFASAGPIFMIPNIASTEHPELGEPWLRHAVAYAIDLDMIATVCQEGLVPPASAAYIKPDTALGDLYIDYDLIEDTYGARIIPHDPAKAIEILEAHCTGSVEEGWTWDGDPIGPWDITTITGWTDTNLMTEFICDSLAEIGIEAIYNVQDWGVVVDSWLAQDFDWSDFTWAAGFPSFGPAYPVNAYAALFSGDPASPGNCGYSASPNYDEVNALIDEMWTEPIGSAESVALAKEIQAMVIPELPYIPLYTQITWSRYNTEYWTNWPSVDNPGPGTTCTWAEQHIPQIIMDIEAVEEEPTPPAEEGEIPWIYVGIGIVVLVLIALLATRRV